MGLIQSLINKFRKRMSDRESFIKRYNDFVNVLVKGTGIFPETIFAQAIIESQKNDEMPGTELAKNYNNLFGIKNSLSWDGKVVDMATKEIYNGKETKITDTFRVYDTPEDSFEDYVNFLQTNERYKNAGVFNSKSVQEQASALQKAGYATNPDYAKLITSVASSISKYITPLNVAVSFAIMAGIFITLYFLSNHE